MTISRSDALIHRTIESGHERLSPRSEIDGDMLAWLRPLVVDALRTGECLPLMDSGWWMRCTTGPGRLAASLWLSRNTGESRTPRDGAAPHVTLTVRLADLSEAELADMKAELAVNPYLIGPCLPLETQPVLEVSMKGIAALSDAELAEQAATEAGNLERCIAWAWLITQEPEA